MCILVISYRPSKTIWCELTFNIFVYRLHCFKSLLCNFLCC